MRSNPHPIDADDIDPMLAPATRLLWRSDHTLQLELGDRAVVVDGLDHGVVRRLVARGAVPAPDRPPGPTAAPALADLADDGFLWPRLGTDPEWGDHRLRAPAPSLAAELIGLTVRHGDRANAVLAARDASSVAVHGTGRAGPVIAALLAASGVGSVSVVGPGTVALHQIQPGGLTPADEGRPWSGAAAKAVERAAPGTDSTPPPLGLHPDLTILAEDGQVAPERSDTLHGGHAAHLVVRESPGAGVVGPLVVPGLTGCLRCADRHRADRDPAWPALSVQLGERQRRRPGSEAAVTALVSAVATQQALAFLDGDRPAVFDGTLEVHPPDWRIRRRTWPPHPECDCIR